MPYLRAFKQTAAGYQSIEYKIGEIFGEVRNKFQNGYLLQLLLTIFFRAHSSQR